MHHSRCQVTLAVPLATLVNGDKFYSRVVRALYQVADRCPFSPTNIFYLDAPDRPVYIQCRLHVGLGPMSISVHERPPGGAYDPLTRRSRVVTRSFFGNELSATKSHTIPQADRMIYLGMPETM